MAGDRDRAPARASRRSLGDDVVLVVVNLDPFAIHDGALHHPVPRSACPSTSTVVDALTGESYAWGGRNYVRLGPGRAHVLEVHA